MFKQVFLPILAVTAFIIIVGLMSQGKILKIKPIFTPKPEVKQNILIIGDAKIEVEIAKSDSERQKGLSKIKFLTEDSGMLFIIPKNTVPVFWMKDTLIPLDIIWIKDNKIIGINKNVPTEINKPDSELTKYQSPGYTDYVLEVNAGFCDKHGITSDQTISGLEHFF